MNQNPPTPPPSNQPDESNFDPQTGQSYGHMGEVGHQLGQPVQPGSPYTSSYTPGYPQQPYPPQGGQPYQQYGYPPREPSSIGQFFSWIFDFKLKTTAAKPAHRFAYLLSLLAVFAFAFARLIDSISGSFYYFEYGYPLEGIWEILANLVAVPLVTLAVLGLVRLGFDALITIANPKEKEVQE